MGSERGGWHPDGSRRRSNVMREVGIAVVMVVCHTPQTHILACKRRRGGAGQGDALFIS